MAKWNYERNRTDQHIEWYYGNCAGTERRVAVCETKSDHRSDGSGTPSAATLSSESIGQTVLWRRWTTSAKDICRIMATVKRVARHSEPSKNTRAIYCADRTVPATVERAPLGILREHFHNPSGVLDETHKELWCRPPSPRVISLDGTVYEAAHRGITVFVTTIVMDEAEYCGPHLHHGRWKDPTSPTVDRPNQTEEQFDCLRPGMGPKTRIPWSSHKRAKREHSTTSPDLVNSGLYEASGSPSGTEYWEMGVRPWLARQGCPIVFHPLRPPHLTTPYFPLPPPYPHPNTKKE